jgi:sensor domain CHASE-containing protein
LQLSSIKGKTGLIILSFFILYGALSYGIYRFTISPYFRDMEVGEARQNLFRVLEVVFNEVERIDSFPRDWATWADAALFLTDRSSEHLEKHLLPETFMNNRVNLIAFCTAAGEMAWWGCYDLVTEAPMTGVASLEEQILAATPLFTFEPGASGAGGAKNGVLLANPYPLLVSSHPVLDGGNRNSIKGCIIMGRFLTPGLMDEFEAQSEVDFELQPLPEGDDENGFRKIADQITDQTPYIVRTGPDGFLYAYTTAPDIYNNMSLLVASKSPGKIIRAGNRTMLYAIASMLVAGVVIFFGLRLILQRVIVSPVSDLTDRMIMVGKTGDLSARLMMTRSDEIGALGREFDGMLERLEEKDRELVDANVKLGEEVQERQRLINELQKALSEVKTLSGLLPICSHCKKIRDDKGYWNQIESYIYMHSDAKFSHGMCPDCFKRLYPEIYEEGDGEEV